MIYFTGKTAEQLADLHNNAFKDSSKSTKTTFYQSLKRIEKIYDAPMIQLQLKFLNSPDDFCKTLDASKYSENTKLTTITCVLKLLKLIDSPLVLYNQWLTILKQKTETRSKNDNNVLKQKLEVLMDYKTIRQLVADASVEYIQESKEEEQFKNFLILSLFTLQIPVRISNYVNMKVIDDGLFLDDVGNFLLLENNEYKLIFNKYRTSHILGKKEMTIHEEILQYLIDKWLSEYNKDSNNFLIVSNKNKRAMNGRQIEEAIKEASKDVFEIPLSVDNIRASYMKRIIELDPNFQDKLDISNILGYSTTSVLDKHSS
jgi:hypothetical protein